MSLRYKSGLLLDADEQEDSFIFLIRKGNIHYVGLFVKSFLTIKKELICVQYGHDGIRYIQV